VHTCRGSGDSKNLFFSEDNRQTQRRLNLDIILFFPLATRRREEEKRGGEKEKKVMTTLACSPLSVSLRVVHLYYIA